MTDNDNTLAHLTDTEIAAAYRKALNDHYERCAEVVQERAAGYWLPAPIYTAEECAVMDEFARRGLDWGD